MADDRRVGEQEKRLGDQREEGGDGQAQDLTGIPLLRCGHRRTVCRVGTDPTPATQCADGPLADTRHDRGVSPSVPWSQSS